MTIMMKYDIKWYWNPWTTPACQRSGLFLRCPRELLLSPCYAAIWNFREIWSIQKKHLRDHAAFRSRAKETLNWAALSPLFEESPLYLSLINTACFWFLANYTANHTARCKVPTLTSWLHSPKLISRLHNSPTFPFLCYDTQWEHLIMWSPLDMVSPNAISHTPRHVC